MGLTGRRFTNLLLLLFFLHALVLNGVVLTRPILLSSPGKVASVITFDVCGRGAHAGVVQNFDITLAVAAPHTSFMPVEKIYPPMPDEAVASAEPGEIEKPPEA